MDCRSCRTPLPSDARFCMNCGADVTDPGTSEHQAVPANRMAELELRLSRTLGSRYKVHRLLGAGGMAAVFLADELGLDRPVAIKVLPPELSRDEGLVARFQREAKTAAKLDHPHIIPIHRVESEGGLHYFVMKYVPGRSLEDLLGGPPLPIPFVTRILTEAAAALAHAHTRGIVHRDVKPANIMLDPDDRVVLTDFGISKAGENASLTQTGIIVGTPHYMAPEQAMGLEVDGRADQYALGIVAYHMLAGKRPFEGESAHTVLYRHVHESPEPIGALRADAPETLIQAVTIAMSKDRGKRFASMDEFARAISGDRSALISRTAPTGAMPRDDRLTPSRIPTQPLTVVAAQAVDRRRRRTAVWAGSAAAVAGIATIGWFAMTGGATAVAESGATPVASADSTSPPTTASAVPAVDTIPASGPGPGRSSGSAESAPSRRPPVQAASTTQPAPERPAPPRTATLTVAADPYAVLYVDNVQIGDTPVVNYPLEVGNRYQLRLEREGYVTMRETITVDGPNPIRRHYSMEPVRHP